MDLKWCKCIEFGLGSCLMSSVHFPQVLNITETNTRKKDESLTHWTPKQEKKNHWLIEHPQSTMLTMLPIRGHWWESSISWRYSCNLTETHTRQQQQQHWLIEHQNNKKDESLTHWTSPVDNVDNVADPRTLMRIIHYPESQARIGSAGFSQQQQQQSHPESFPQKHQSWLEASNNFMQRGPVVVFIVSEADTN